MNQAVRFDNMYAIACYLGVTIDDILVGNRQDFFGFELKLHIKPTKNPKFLCIFPLEFRCQ